MSRQEFATHLKIGLRTVGDWHENPDARPQAKMQRTLDTAYEEASAAVRERFAIIRSKAARKAGSPEGDDSAREEAGRGLVTADSRHGVAMVMADGRTIHVPPEPVRAPAGVTAAEGLHNLPAPPNRVFVDREEDLAELTAVMSLEPPASPPVVHGLGGAGKSTLALQFAHACRDRYNPVWWIPAGSAASVTQGLADLAARLLPDENIAARTSAEAADWAIGWLQAHPGWLLVFDDVDTPGSIEPVLGTLADGRHLITSRRATGWHRIGRPLPLATLPPDAAVDMLMQIISPDDDPGRDAHRLAAKLGYLPLALEQAAAYIKRAEITPTIYLDRLRRWPARMFATSADSQASGETDRQRTVAQVWQLSLAAIEDEQPLAGEILRTLGWLGSDPIPRDLAYELDEDPLTVDEALALLHAYSMITLTPRTITIHRLVQAVARIPDPADPHRTPEAISRARDRAARLLLDSLPEAPLFHVDTWPRWRELLPHVLALTDHIGPGHDTPATAAILSAASGFLQGDGLFRQAIATAQRAVDAYEQVQGPDDPDTLTARSFLASAHRAAGDIATATPLHERNLADAERVLGPDHPETLSARANLAYLLALRDGPGDAARSLELHERNLADYERVLGPDHPHTLNARANLASSCRALGYLGRAIELHEQSVTDYARIFGADHSETVTARSNLAYAYQLAGDPGRAVPLHQQVLADRERLYGPDHRFTAVARQLLTTAQHQASENPDGRDAEDE